MAMETLHGTNVAMATGYCNSDKVELGKERERQEERKRDCVLCRDIFITRLCLRSIKLII
jgi:hypothetical protein